MEMLFLIVIVGLVWAVMSLRSRVTELEKAFSRLAFAPTAPDVRTIDPVRHAVPDTLPPIPAVAGGEDAFAGVQATEIADAAVLIGDANDIGPLDQNQPLVMRPDRFATLAIWVRNNWVYVISAVSLAFAGVYFVQYGMEKGLLPPAARVTMAVLFGMLLVAAGEWIRRRHGDDTASTTAYLPSTFSGAGLISMFAGVIAARQLYDLIGVETAFAGIVAVAVLAIILGWFYESFLVAVGLIGMAAAPFVVGGAGNDVTWLLAYFAVIAFVGLAIDAVRRWAWVSVLALGLAYAGGFLVLSQIDAQGWGVVFLTVIAVLAILVPVLHLVPDHDGPLVTQCLLNLKTAGWPTFPVRLAAGAMLVSSIGLAGVMPGSAAESGLALACTVGLTLALIWWSVRANALSDLAGLPALAFLVRVVTEPLWYQPLAVDFAQSALALRPAETSAPMTVSLILLAAIAITALAAWRSGSGRQGAIWAFAAAIVAPATALLLELFWFPREVIGAYPWALQIMALAALMVLFAARFARADGGPQRRTAYMVLAAMVLIALALFIIISKAALTFALAVLVVVAALLDKRFKLPEMGWFIQVGVMVLGWRMVVDPGLDWAFNARFVEVVAAFVAAIGAMLGGLWVLRGMDRTAPKVFLESALAGLAAIFANIVLTRWLDSLSDPFWVEGYLSITGNAAPWLVLALVQLYRLKLGGQWMTRLRITLAFIGGMIWLAGMAVAVTLANPVIGFYSSAQVYGPPVFDTLLLAYAVPGAMLIWSRRRLGHLPRGLRFILTGLGVALLAFYAGLEIRRFWRGDRLYVPGVTQAELYSYTVAMMLTGAGLLYQAIAKHSATLRRAAMAVIALTVAKVFLIDAAGLSGLTRVFSFLALGLSLAGLAWLNRWVVGQGSAADDPPTAG